jgi:hypothetical protein
LKPQNAKHRLSPFYPSSFSAQWLLSRRFRIYSIDGALLARHITSQQATHHHLRYNTRLPLFRQFQLPFDAGRFYRSSGLDDLPPPQRRLLLLNATPPTALENFMPVTLLYECMLLGIDMQAAADELSDFDAAKCSTFLITPQLLRRFLIAGLLSIADISLISA